MTYRAAFIIGLCQATAILPGISRSGTTIAAGLGLGLKREAAAAFSFLLALPVVAGACALEFVKLFRATAPPAVPWPTLAAGIGISFVVGVLALVWLLRWLEGGKLHWFAWWCIPLGIAVVWWQLAGPGPNLQAPAAFRPNPGPTPIQEAHHDQPLRPAPPAGPRRRGGT
jgi:undecaprenyl-diphosphatase